MSSCLTHENGGLHSFLLTLAHSAQQGEGSFIHSKPLHRAIQGVHSSEVLKTLPIQVL